VSCAPSPADVSTVLGGRVSLLLLGRINHKTSPLFDAWSSVFNPLGYT